MKKKVILTLTGSCEQGMSASLRILASSSTNEFCETLQVSGQLPPTGQMLKVFQSWQRSYRLQIKNSSRMKFIQAQITQISCQELSTELEFEFNKWLNQKHDGWQKIRDGLQQNLNKLDDILLIIETQSRLAQQLPWHLWKLFNNDYRRCEIVISPADYQSLRVISPPTNKVKILAVLGNDEGIDIGQDRSALRSLPNTEVCFLVKPERHELNKQLWKQGWDILFFAGHAGSNPDGTNGVIYLNENESLTISDLKYALIKAIENGLKLAIFNSCDGLAIAQELASLNIPRMIVMREPVPDKVAQEFLKHFLLYFASGKSFHLAVRSAREQLQGIETQFPCASWLPVIFQNSLQAPLTWKQLYKSEQSKRGSLLNKYGLNTVLLFSICVTALIALVRYLGLLQIAELQALDQLIQLRPDEPPDSRIVIIEVTENDLKLPQQTYRKGSLSDAALSQILEKLSIAKPRVIGLDIYRDYPVEPGLTKLATQMQQNQNLIAVCKISDAGVNDPGIASPPEITTDRLGFSDFITDPDGILRRQLLSTGIEPTSPCTSPYAFSVQLAFRYLAAVGILPKVTSYGDLQFGQVVIKGLGENFGSYRNAISGYQIMLNYRSPGEPDNIAARVTLSQVLNGQFHADAFKDKVVIIGTTAGSYQDYWLTPYSSRKKFGQRSAGVIAQAQMTSQILSAVLDRRSQLWAMPYPSDIVWIFGSAIVAGLLAIKLKSPIRLGLGLILAQISLYGLSFGLLLYSGCWIPLLPSSLALFFTGSSVAICTRISVKPQQFTQA